MGVSGEACGWGGSGMVTVRTLTVTAHGARTRYPQVRHATRLRKVHDPYELLSLIDPISAGRLMAVSPSWLLALARKGDIPHYQLGAYVRFEVNELKRWLELHRKTPATNDRPGAPADGS